MGKHLVPMVTLDTNQIGFWRFRVCHVYEQSYEAYQINAAIRTAKIYKELLEEPLKLN